MKPVEERFKEFIKGNPAFYFLFERYALDAVKAAEKRGCNYISADMICHAIRFKHFIEGTEEYKVNNSYVAYLSRMFQKRYPEHRHLFRNRRTQKELAETAIY